MTAVSPWNRLTVRRFRGIRRVSLEDLGAFNVLVGANDTGKTSVLEAVFLLSGSGNLTMPIKVQNLRDELVHTLDDLSCLFHECDVTAGIELSATTLTPASSRTLSITAADPDAQSHVVSSHGSNAMSYGPRSPATASPAVSLPTHGALRYDLTMSGNAASSRSRHSGSLTLLKAEQIVRTDASLSETTIPARFLRSRFEHDADAVGDVVVNKKKQELLECLRFVNPRIQDIAVSGSSAFLDVGLARMLPITMFGSGMVRACSTIAHCVLGRDRILLVDEVSSGLHYAARSRLLRALLHFSTQAGLQMFVTTHSLGVLQGLQEILDDEEMVDLRDVVACYALRRDHGGQVRAYRYGYEELDHCIRSGIEIR